MLIKVPPSFDVLYKSLGGLKNRTQKNWTWTSYIAPCQNQRNSLKRQVLPRREGDEAKVVIKIIQYAKWSIERISAFKAREKKNGPKRLGFA